MSDLSSLFYRFDSCLRHKIMKKIKVYGTPTCPHCQILKKELEDNNINFEYIDVSGSSELIDMVTKKTGQRTVPIINIGDVWVAGSDIKKILKVINK